MSEPTSELVVGVDPTKPGSERTVMTERYRGKFRVLSKSEQRLIELAFAYEQRCEAYDQAVCEARSPRGDALPQTFQERRLVEEHARKVFAEMLTEVQALGYTPADFRKTIREVNR